MRFIIYAYNPKYVNVAEIENLAKELDKHYGCQTFLVAHLDDNAEPIYCVQFADTTATHLGGMN